MPETRFTEFATLLEVRDKDGTSGDGRTLTGVAVPAGERGQIGPDEYERILPNAFDGSPDVILCSLHGPKGGIPIGTVEHWASPEGVMVRARVSDTSAGNDALTLLRDGVYKGLSVGYISDRDSFDSDGTVCREKARLFEVALVPSPAFKGAKVLSIRSEEGTPMSDDNEITEVKTDIVHLREENQDLARRIAAMNTGTGAKPGYVTRYATVGQWIKGLAAGDTEAFEVNASMRDYTGSTTSDFALRPSYVADQIRLVEQLRVGISCFSSAPLPDSGMTLDYLKIDADDSAAAEQVHEGDELVQSKVSLTHASADIKTYGSWASMSLQAVQRSPVSVVDLTYQAMVRQVAKTTDLAFLTALAAAAAGTPVVRAADTATGWADGIIEAELQLATLGLGLPAEGILTNLVDFGKLAKLRIGEFPVVIGPGVRTLQAMGSVDPVNAYAAGARGFFNGLPIFVDPNLADHVTYVYNSAAMCVYGNPAPIRLSGDWDSSTVKTLTSAFSVYLMTAIAAPWPAAIVAVTPHA